MNVHYFHSYIGTPFALVLSNAGSGPVLVSEITVNYDRGNAVFYIGKKIEKGEFLSTMPDDIHQFYTDLAGYENSEDGTASPLLLENGNAWLSADPRRRGCFAVFFINKEAEDIKRMNEFFENKGTRLITKDVDARLVYFDAKTGNKVRESFPVVATYLRSLTSECSHFRSR